MTEYAKRFAWWFLALATVAALYLAAEKAGVARWFLGVTVASVILAAIPIIINWLIKVRRYPILLAEAEQLRATAATSTGRITELEQSLQSEYQRGINEGQMQIIGSQLGGLCREIPVILAVSSQEDNVVLVANAGDDANLLIGARFEVQAQITHERKGVVEVIDIEPHTRSVSLSCVEATVPAFWESLVQRAPVDPSPPVGMQLARYSPEVTLEYLALLAPANQDIPMEE